jgi:hypothetical protein
MGFEGSHGAIKCFEQDGFACAIVTNDQINLPQVLTLNVTNGGKVSEFKAI